MLKSCLEKAIIQKDKYVQTIKLALSRQKKSQTNKQDNYFNELFEEDMPDSIRLLDTTELNLEIKNMFKNEKHFILILSPYLNLTLEIQTILATSPAKVVIIWRDETKEDNKKPPSKIIEGFKKSMPNVEFIGVPYFHSKAYITSGTLVVTSLNLIECSQIKNFELGIILKETSYNKIILTLRDKLKLLFDMYKLDKNILDELKLPTINDLLKDILKKSKKEEYAYTDVNYLCKLSKIMLEKYTFDRNDKWKRDENMLLGGVKVNQDMYEWALENISL